MSAAAPSGSGCIASFVHATLCTAAFLLVILSGALVAWYVKLAGSDAAFDLHRKLQVHGRWHVHRGGHARLAFHGPQWFQYCAQVVGAVLLMLYGVWASGSSACLARAGHMCTAFCSLGLADQSSCSDSTTLGSAWMRVATNRSCGI
ncbi:hypothetical protein F5148DRAFT_1256255 [Russula earlei]|uniref:Uncharacterized protein n=1 Tax=Russula earlei TaxID=71964 RepID=A0ACC0TST7_9AGAM|nr:hypothetical protein F5148DRAFT_1256255 [Russula earlei]